MIEHINASGLSDPPGYSHAVVASQGRLVATAGAVPFDSDGNLVGSRAHEACWEVVRHARERTESTQPTRFSKLFRRGHSPE